MSNSSPPPRWIVLDDLDSSIEYGDGWFAASDSLPNFETWDNAGFGLTYLGSLHGTTSNTSLSFTFDGSAILLSGSNNPKNTSGVITPSWDCLIDGRSIGTVDPFPFAANNWDFCSWEGEPGIHTLRVPVTTDGQTFYVDRIKYIPTPGSKAAGQGEDNVVEIVRNDNAIKLGKGWRSLGNTANFTTEQGAQAEIEFYGTRLSWWAFIPGELPKAPSSGTYTIDDGRTTSFTLKGLAPNDPTTYHQMLFQTPQLAKGPHRIVVTYEGDGETVTPLPLTHVLVHNGNATAPLPGDPSVFELASASSAVPAPSSTQSQTPSENEQAPQSSTPVGAIVGGVLGGLLLISATFILFFWLRRRQRAKNREPEAVQYPSPTAPIEPFYVPPQTAQYNPQNPSYHSVPTASSKSAGLDQGHRPNQSSTSGYTTSGQSTSPFPNPTTSGSASQSSGMPPIPVPLQPRRKGDAVHPPGSESAYPQSGSEYVGSGEARSHNASRVVLHEDSGLRNLQGVAEDVVELPPQYTAQ